MKIREKIKKVLKSIFAIVMFLPHNIYAAETTPLDEVAYGIPQTTSTTASTYVKMFIIPVIAIIIGLIVYYRKSKHKISEKIAVTLLIVGILCLFLNIIDLK